MRRHELVNEIAANIASRKLRTLLSLTIAALFGGVVAVAAVTTGTAADIEREQREFLGEFVVAVVAQDGAPLDAVRCDAVAGLPGVKGAGGIMTRSPRISVDGSRVDTATVTPKFVTVAWPSKQTDSPLDVIAGRAVTQRMYLYDHVRLEWADAGDVSSLRVDRAATERSRIPEMDGALALAAPPAGTVERCLVDIDPQWYQAVRAVLTTWDMGAPSIQGPLWVASDTDVDPDSGLKRHRVTALWAAVVIIVGGWRAFDVRLRRTDFGLYRVLGVRRRQVVAMVAVEHLLTTVVPLAVGFTVVMTLMHPAGAALRLAFSDGGLMVGLAFFAAIPAAIPALTSRVIDSFKGHGQG